MSSHGATNQGQPDGDTKMPNTAPKAIRKSLTQSPFPVIKFGKLPKGFDAGQRNARTVYEWERLNPAEGIEVPREKYDAALTSASNFAKNHPLDDKGRVREFGSMMKMDDDNNVIREKVMVTVTKDGKETQVEKELPVAYLIIRKKAAMPEKA